MASSSLTSPEVTPSISRCIVEHDTETLSLEVTNYLQLKDMEAGKFVSSSVCRVGGYEWEIRFYPAGRSDSTDTASCYLCYLGKDKYVRAKFTLSMVETRGLQAQIVSFGALDYAFTPGLNDYGYPKFVTRSKLKSLARRGDGCFTIRCVLNVKNESPPLELHDDLERMLEEGLGADVTFAVGGRELGAHRSLLAARSPVFRAQFFGPMAEKKEMSHVEVIDVEPTIFKMMLRYIYTDSPPPCKDDGGGYNAAIMQHLLIAADRYGLNRLKLMCEGELCKRMDVATVMTMVSLADRHHCERLKDACLEFMSSKKVLAALTETDVFKEYINTYYSRPLPLDDGLGQKGQLSTDKE